ncbi:anti-sigma factor [Streptomyces purpurogeneiscleroticus]|uniref:anti-sigma factor n=1 Tax=Streptomyces purpurogeneiscleroticus TaxID=68259 RepID=UPI001CBC4B92|nr:anti-sigma factor [Streptomyces purpurogeneiscleroticus]MBZ4017772.1 anti-sigma factor [Streptomyces purpurogeneiscleroticus]
MTSADLHTATGAYVLHALPPAERHEFERHLAVCEACTQEVREFSATAERLGLAVAETPPPEMKDRVLQAIDSVRQEPPQVAARGGARGWSRSLSRFALAACVAAAAAFGGVAVWQHQAAQDARSRAHQAEEQAARLSAVFTAPDAKVTKGRLKDGATGTVVVSRARDKAVFLASGLPALPEDKVYQLWFNDGGTMRSAGLMGADGGARAALLEGPVGRASGMGITVEPDGGSAQPTSAPIGLLEFPA